MDDVINITVLTKLVCNIVTNFQCKKKKQKDFQHILKEDIHAKYLLPAL